MNNLQNEYEKSVDLFGQGRREEAAAALEELIKKQPDFFDAYESLGMVYYKNGKIRRGH